MRTTREVRSAAAAARAPVPNPAATRRPPSGPSRRRQGRSSPFPRAPSAPPLPHLWRRTGAPPLSFLAPAKQGPRRRVGGEGQLGRRRPRNPSGGTGNLPGGDERHPELRWQPSSVATAGRSTMASSRKMAAPGRRPAQEGSDRAAELRWSMASRCTPRRRRRRISGGAPRRTRRRSESMPPPASLPSLPSVPSIRAKGVVVVARRDGR
jgi:hypothetical protein